MPLRGEFVATVNENRAICREHFRLELSLPEFPETSPGQFVQILCRDPDADASDVERDWSIGGGDDWLNPEAMLRRPFSIAGRCDGPKGVELTFVHRVVGVATAWLAKLREG